MKKDNIFWSAFVVVFIVVFAFWILLDDSEHIEDINGPNNYTLSTITRHDIINDKIPGKNLKPKPCQNIPSSSRPLLYRPPRCF